MTISKERLEAIQNIDDDDIDFSDIPELDDEWFENAKIVMPAKTNEVAISMRIDPHVLSWYKAQGRSYQTLMNAVLKAYAESR